MGSMALLWCGHQSAAQWIDRPPPSVAALVPFSVPEVFRAPVHSSLTPAPRLRRVLVARPRVLSPTGGPQTLWHSAAELMSRARGGDASGGEGVDWGPQAHHSREGRTTRRRAAGTGTQTQAGAEASPGSLLDIWDLESPYMAADPTALASEMSSLLQR